MRRSSAWAAPLVALAAAGPGCGTMVAQGITHGQGALPIPFGGVCVDLIACLAIYPVPLVALDLPLSLCADVVLALGELVGTEGGDVLRLDLAAPAWPELVGREAGPIRALACSDEGLVAWASPKGGVVTRRGLEAARPLPVEVVWPAEVVDLAFAHGGLWLAASDGTARCVQPFLGNELARIDLRALDDAPLRLRSSSSRDALLLTERGAVLAFLGVDAEARDGR